jgi:hypothetical protein
MWSPVIFVCNFAVLQHRKVRADYYDTNLFAKPGPRSLT